MQPAMETGDAAWSKQALRAVIQARRRAQPGWLRAWRSRAIAAAARRLSAWKAARLVLLYAPVRGEVDPGALARAAWREGRGVAYPRVAGPGRLVFHRVRSQAELVAGAFGVPEPRADAATAVDPRNAGFIAVPGVAFSLAGDRLGWGGGFYDALLAARRGAPGVAVGLAFAFQVHAAIPVEARDEAVAAVVTERGVRLVTAAAPRPASPR